MENMHKALVLRGLFFEIISFLYWILWLHLFFFFHLSTMGFFFILFNLCFVPYWPLLLFWKWGFWLINSSFICNLFLKMTMRQIYAIFKRRRIFQIQPYMYIPKQIHWSFPAKKGVSNPGPIPSPDSTLIRQLIIIKYVFWNT